MSHRITSSFLFLLFILLKRGINIYHLSVLILLRYTRSLSLHTHARAHTRAHQSSWILMSSNPHLELHLRMVDVKFNGERPQTAEKTPHVDAVLKVFLTHNTQNTQNTHNRKTMPFFLGGGGSQLRSFVDLCRKKHINFCKWGLSWKGADVQRSCGDGKDVLTCACACVDQRGAFKYINEPQWQRNFHAAVMLDVVHGGL